MALAVGRHHGRGHLPWQTARALGGDAPCPCCCGFVFLPATPRPAMLCHGANPRPARCLPACLPQFGPKVEVERPSGLKGQVPTLDFGFGLAFELDTAELQPQVGGWGEGRP